VVLAAFEDESAYLYLISGVPRKRSILEKKRVADDFTRGNIGHIIYTKHAVGKVLRNQGQI
jgi:hypothetical protein